MPINDRTTSKTGSLFNKLQGKQIWHMTAPAGVSLQNLKELAMDKALNREAILSYKGADYRLLKTDNDEDGTWEVLVPQGDGYKAGMFL